MRRLVWVWVAAHIWAVGPAFSQAEETLGNPTRFSFRASANAVHLNVSVVNKKGKLITDLEQTDFWVLENDVIQEITYFSHGTDAPVDVVLLIDASGSMDVTEKTANARNAAIQLIHGLGPEDRVAVYAFDKDLYRLTDFTKTKEDAIDALTRLSPFGSTALYDAVVTLSDYVIHQGFGHRAIVIVTDGIDTSSEATIEQAVEKAKGVDLPVYAFRVLSPVDDPESDLFLVFMARASEVKTPSAVSPPRPAVRSMQAVNGASSLWLPLTFAKSSKPNIESVMSQRTTMKTATSAAFMSERVGGESRFEPEKVTTQKSRVRSSARLARRPTIARANRRSAMSNKRNRVVVTIAAVLVASGCSTKKYVSKEVGAVNQKSKR